MSLLWLLEPYLDCMNFNSISNTHDTLRRRGDTRRVRGSLLARSYQAHVGVVDEAGGRLEWLTGHLPSYSATAAPAAISHGACVREIFGLPLC